MKTIICNIPMARKKATVYQSTDRTLSVANKAVLYPVSAFLECNLCKDEEIKLIALTKNDNIATKENVRLFYDEIEQMLDLTKAKIVSKQEINTEFSEKKETHEELLLRIVDALEIGDHIIADITHGPKDMPIVAFTAFNFAEKYMKCEIENIVYGQAEFEDGELKNTQICDMSPLYYLNNITNTIDCNDPQRAKLLLKSIIEL